MVINAFDIYDIFADLVPGTVATILLLVVAAPAEGTSRIIETVSGIGAGLIFISIAYVAGRIVRNISNITNYVLGIVSLDKSFKSFVDDMLFSHRDPLEITVKNRFLHVIYSKAEIAGSLDSESIDIILDIGYSEL